MFFYLAGGRALELVHRAPDGLMRVVDVVFHNHRPDAHDVRFERAMDVVGARLRGTVGVSETCVDAREALAETTECDVSNGVGFMPRAVRLNQRSPKCKRN